jgi:hypothetical protein
VIHSGSIRPRRRLMAILLAAASLVACTGPRATRNDEFAGEGQIRATFVIGRHEFDGSEWVDMVSTTGPTSERCDLLDCGLSVHALRTGAFWNAGDWIVVAPTVKGWVEPAPFEVTVTPGRITEFVFRYERATGSPPWEEGIFDDPDFPIGLGLVFENGWRRVIDGDYVAVLAGARRKPETLQPTDEGVILVEVIEPKTWGHRFFLVEAPIPGPVKIESAAGHRLTVVSPSGETAVFDVDVRRFL